MPKFDRSQIPDFVLDSTIIQSMLGSAATRTAGPPDGRELAVLWQVTDYRS